MLFKNDACNNNEQQTAQRSNLIPDFPNFNI